MESRLTNNITLYSVKKKKFYSIPRITDMTCTVLVIQSDLKHTYYVVTQSHPKPFPQGHKDGTYHRTKSILLVKHI